MERCNLEKNPILEFIERLPFFREFSEDEKSKLVTTSGIFEKFKEGHISLQEPEDITIAELKPGSIFGEISLISDRPRNTSAHASSQQVVVMKITQEIIERFNLVIQKKFQAQLIIILVERLDDMNTKYIKLKSSTPKD